MWASDSPQHPPPLADVEDAGPHVVRGSARFARNPSQLMGSCAPTREAAQTDRTITSARVAEAEPPRLWVPSFRLSGARHTVCPYPVASGGITRRFVIACPKAGAEKILAPKDGTAPSTSRLAHLLWATIRGSLVFELLQHGPPPGFPQLLAATMAGTTRGL